MAFWILKTEPSSYSFDDLKREQSTNWDGVRNYQARNNILQMRRGDHALIYHSVGPKELVGTVLVTKEAFKDPTAPEGNWAAVEITIDKELKAPVHLSQLKEDPRLANLSLIKQSRLSVCPVSNEEWKVILQLSQKNK